MIIDTCLLLFTVSTVFGTCYCSLQYIQILVHIEHFKVFCKALSLPHSQPRYSCTIMYQELKAFLPSSAQAFTLLQHFKLSLNSVYFLSVTFLLTETEKFRGRQGQGGK